MSMMGKIIFFSVLNASGDLYFDWFISLKGCKNRGKLVQTAWLGHIILAMKNKSQQIQLRKPESTKASGSKVALSLTKRTN